MTSKWQTDWSKCCICQKDKHNEDLKSPPTRYSCEQDGYTMIATNVPLFHTLNEMPLVLDPATFDEGGVIEETLKKNKAQYHQNCRYLFQNYRLERARKRQPSPGSTQSIEGCTKLRRTSHECFVCDEEEPKSDLRQVMTMNLDKRLNDCVQTLNDEKLMAKLSGGDAIDLFRQRSPSDESERN